MAFDFPKGYFKPNKPSLKGAAVIDQIWQISLIIAKDRRKSD